MSGKESDKLSEDSTNSERDSVIGNQLLELLKINENQLKEAKLSHEKSSDSDNEINPLTINKAENNTPVTSDLVHENEQKFAQIQNYRKNRNNGIICSYCNKKGHPALNCLHLVSHLALRSTGLNRENKKSCYICGKSGHISKNCFHRTNLPKPN